MGQQKKVMRKPVNIIIGILLLVVVGLIAYIIFRQPPIAGVIPFDDTTLIKKLNSVDSLSKAWEKEALHWKEVANDAITKTDSLQNLKPKIRYEYHKVYISTRTASHKQLDSTIRANW